MKKIFTVWMALTLMASSAFATTIYCKMAQDWWKSDGAAVGAYAWKGENASGGKNANWPGERMTPTNQADVWAIDIDLTMYENIIFTRVNNEGDVADWGAKTKDQVIPTDGKNLFTITSESPVWGDPGCDGEWSVYGEGGGGQPQPQGDYDYYLRGWWNGSDAATPTPNELFENGKLEDFSFTSDEARNYKGYFYVMVCEVGQVVGVDYMLDGYSEASHATLKNKSEIEEKNLSKLGVPQGTVTFYLYDNEDGTLELSTEELPGKKLVGGGGGSTPGEQEAVENTKAVVKARKAIIDGRLVIIRGEKMFDATGRAL